jgi:hypothetical protein
MGYGVYIDVPCLYCTYSTLVGNRIMGELGNVQMDNNTLRTYIHDYK